MHGIYAGDVYQLSARTLLPTAWQYEGKYEGILRGFAAIAEKQRPANTQPVIDNSATREKVPDKPRMKLYNPTEEGEQEAIVTQIVHGRELDDEFQKMFDPSLTSTFTFRNGLGQLVEGLSESLKKNAHIEILTGTRFQSAKKVVGEKGDTTIEITSSSAGETVYISHLSTSTNSTLTSYLPDHNITTPHLRPHNRHPPQPHPNPLRNRNDRKPLLHNTPLDPDPHPRLRLPNPAQRAL